MKYNCLTDMFHQYIERLALGKDINAYPSATLKSAIRIYFKFDKRGHIVFIGNTG